MRTPIPFVTSHRECALLHQAARAVVVGAVTRQVRARLAALVGGGVVGSGGGGHVQKSTARRSA